MAGWHDIFELHSYKWNHLEYVYILYICMCCMQELVLLAPKRRPVLDPRVLSPLTLLQRLSLTDTVIYKAEDLLQSVQQMPHLAQLQLCNIDWNNGGSVPRIQDPQLFTALTAHSGLPGAAADRAALAQAVPARAAPAAADQAAAGTQAELQSGSL